nr:outer membrane beta-barrel protein [uncultured Carboxylicivirga sp.]
MIRILLLAFTLAIATYIKSQNKDEINFHLGPGYSTYRINLNHSAETSSKLNTSIGLGYNYKIIPALALKSGIELTKYQSLIRIDELKDNYMTNDNYQNNFEWRLTINLLEENHSGLYLNLPLLLQYSPERMARFYTNFGLIIGIPLQSNYKATYSNIITSGYYPETDVEYTDINFRGFGEFDGNTSSGELSTNTAFILHYECGMKWNLSNAINLYLGGFVDYGINNILKEDDFKRIIVYNENNPTSFSYNSMAISEYTNNENTVSYFKKMTPISIGIHISLGFSL